FLRSGRTFFAREGEAMRGSLAGSLGLTLGLFVSAVQAEDYSWRPTAVPPRVTVQLGQPRFEAAPVATLGRPQPPAPIDTIGTPSKNQDTSAPPYPLARAQAADLPTTPLYAPAPPPTTPAPPLSNTELYNCGVVTRTARTGILEGGKDLFNRIPGVSAVF